MYLKNKQTGSSSTRRGLRRLAPGALLLAAGLALSGCGAQSSGESGQQPQDGVETLRIGVFLGSLTNTYEAAQLEGIEEVAGEYNAEVVQVFDAAFDAQAQVAQLQDAIASGNYDAFAIDPADGGAVVPEIEDAIESGILVGCMLVACGPDPTSAERQIEGIVTSVGFHFDDSGRNIAQLIVDACGDLDPCNAVYIPGDMTLPLEQARLDGFNEVVEAAGNVNIVAQQDGHYDTATSRSVMDNILAANPEIHVAASSFDGMTVGIEQAVVDAGREGEIKLIGSGGDEQAVAAVREGRWFGTVVGKPKTEGKLLVKYFREALDSGNTEGIPAFVNVYGDEISPGGPLMTRDRNDLEAEYRS